MNRPVAASAAADAAEKAPHASPSQTRRVTSGEVSSASRVVAEAGAFAVVLAAAAPPTEAAVVVLPAKSGIGGAAGRGVAAGRAAEVVTGGVATGRAAGEVVACGVAAGFAPVAGAFAVGPATGE